MADGGRRGRDPLSRLRRRAADARRANHYAPIFHELVDGDLVEVADDPSGEQTVKVILDTIAAKQSTLD